MDPQPAPVRWTWTRVPLTTSDGQQVAATMLQLMSVNGAFTFFFDDESFDKFVEQGTGIRDKPTTGLILPKPDIAVPHLRPVE